MVRPPGTGAASVCIRRDGYVGVTGIAVVSGGADACVTPVLSLDEVSHDPHMAARGTLETIDGVTAPAPAPRFSRTKPETSAQAHAVGADTDAILAQFGFSAAEISDLGAKGIVGMPV